MRDTFKKVLVIHSSGRISGAEKSLADVLHVLKEKNEVILILPEQGELYARLHAAFPIKIYPITSLKKKNNPLRRLKDMVRLIITSFQVARFVRKERIDIIYSNTTQANLYSIFIKLFTNKKLVWHVRDNLPGKTATAILSRFSDRILCISRHICRQIPGKKKTLLYNGIDIHSWKPSPVTHHRLRQLPGIGKDTVIVGQIGQLIPWKNHGLSIDVAKYIFAENRDVHFILIGRDMFRDYPGYKQGLLERAVREKISHRFTILDFTDDIREYMEEMDILIHLAENEPFGRVIIEAMALEKPVLALNSGGPAEIIAHDRSGKLIDIPDARIIAGQLSILIDDPALRKKYGEEGRKIVVDKFNLDNLEHINAIITAIE